MKKTYILKPNMTFATLTTSPTQGKGATGVPGNSALQIVANPIPLDAPSKRVLPPRQPLPQPVVDLTKPRLQLGLDVHLEFITAVSQRGNTSAHAPRNFTLERLVEQIRQWVAQGLQVFCVQESCGFGFVLHRQLVAAGAQSFLITPIALNGKRKTDKLDARALCLRLSRYLEGNHDELAPIRIPTEAEQRRRECTRRRQFLKREVRRLANRGHGQVAEYCHQSLPGRWWGPRLWKKFSPKMDAWLLGLLEKLRDLILALETQLKALEEELIQRLQGQQRPKGLGDLTLVTLDGEICDWARFHNRKQIGSYTGCCPGEHSSGGKRRVGAIDRMGNGRVRALLVEAVWRFLKWTSAITAISARFDKETNRTLARTVDFQQEFDPFDTELLASCYPIESVTKFELKTSEASGWQEISPTPDFLIRSSCIITLSTPLPTLYAPRSTLARITYSGGYVLPDSPDVPGATRLPPDLEQAAVEQVSAWFQNRDKLGLKTIWPHYGTYQQFYPWDLLPGVQTVLKRYQRWTL